MDHISTIAKKTLHLAETRTSPSQMEKTISDILNDAKQIVVRLNDKTSSEPISKERMSRPQVPQVPQEIIFDKVQLSKETGSLMNASSGDSSKEDATSISAVSTRSVSDGQKILSEIQEEKQTLEELKLHMDESLPILPDVANIQESSEEDRDYFRDESSRGEDYFTSLASLPSNLQAKKNVLENIRGAKNNIRKLSYQLYEAIELTCQSKDRQNYHKALFNLWIDWSRSLSKNVDDTQLLEALTLDLFRSISLKLHLAFMDLMPKVQGLPSSLQDKLQQACYDIQELHITFSLCGGFEDLDKHYLTQSQFKLTQAQGSIEKLYCFLEDSIPSSWIVGPLSSSEYPLSEVVKLPEQKSS
ncbi:perilipin-3-like [Vombatus ursinus]|uniref:perilipin-3-like n=1 Tax=Vombatus ursinus TaxID=29139 RepID=UPI000FFD026E|nr:perilipin-3-like [Vombatus ursinus]